MGSPLNDWIQLFDEKNFESIKNEPEELKSVTMLLITIQNEFRRIETSLNAKLTILKSKCQKGEKDSSKHEIDIIESSPYKENERSSTQNIDGKTLRSPTISRHRNYRLKNRNIKINFDRSSGIVPTKPKVLNTLSTNKCDNKDTIVVHDDEDIFESTIIGKTPDTKKVKKSASMMHFSMKRYFKNLSNNLTVTQTFSEMETKRDDTKDGSSMIDINEILEKVDNEKTITSDKTSDSSKSLTGEHSTVQGKQVSSINSSDLNKCLVDVPSMQDKQISSSFVENYDMIPGSQKSPEKKFVYKETVRGNARKKLKGWSCKECEKFYKDMNLTEKELEQKMNECSKHRSRFKPDEETMPGFWDLSIPSTPESQITQPVASTLSQESVGNDSTIFCLYKN